MTSPDEIVITPEMRRAVYAADCKELGHSIDVRIGYAPSDDPNVLHGRPDEHGGDSELPHLRCRRCRMVWLVLADDPADSYEEAEQKVVKRLNRGDSLVNRAKELADHRKQHASDHGFVLGVGTPKKA